MRTMSRRKSYQSMRRETRRASRQWLSSQAKGRWIVCVGLRGPTHTGLCRHLRAHLAVSAQLSSL